MDENIEDVLDEINQYTLTLETKPNLDLGILTARIEETEYFLMDYMSSVSNKLCNRRTRATGLASFNLTSQETQEYLSFENNDELNQEYDENKNNYLYMDSVFSLHNSLEKFKRKHRQKT